ncbi:pilus assembly protein FimV [Oxalobacteraceae bacterium GrIS 2.11]
MIIIQFRRHFALSMVSLACLTLCYRSAFAIGFGDATVRSNLGDFLRVQVPLNGASQDILVPSCVKPKIETLDGELIDIPRVDLVLPSQPNQPVYINLVSKKVMVEPAVKFTIAMACGNAVQRQYSLLLDFEDSPTVAPARLAALSMPDTQIKAIDSNDNAGSRHGQSPDSAANSNTSSKKSHRPRSESGSPKRKLDAEYPTSAAPTSKQNRNQQVKGKDVLKVSSEDSLLDAGLKMSPMLSDPTSKTADQQRIAENQRAQAEFAAVLRGEDPATVTQTDIKNEQLKNKKLQAELNNIKQQDAVRAEKEKNTSPLVMGLIAAVTALFLALVGLVVVAVNRSRKNKDHTWWDSSAEQKQNVVDIVDYLQTTAEKGNLDPGPITATRMPPTESGIREETVQAAINQEEPSPKFKRMGLPALEDTNSSTFNFFGNRGQSIHIEEISDITQEAEFWMSVNDPHRAIEILEPQSRDENPSTPITWLYLLDLYRLVGDEDNYKDLRQRFKFKFNAKIPNFHEEIVPGSARNFEDFPHLVSNCCALWNTDDIVAYLESLLVDDREGERVGFDLPVYRDILFLLSICAELRRTKHQALPKEDPQNLGTLDSSDGLIVPEPTKKVGLESDEYSNSLNFDLLDFKSVGQNKK